MTMKCLFCIYYDLCSSDSFLFQWNIHENVVCNEMVDLDFQLYEDEDMVANPYDEIQDPEWLDYLMFEDATDGNTIKFYD